MQQTIRVTGFSKSSPFFGQAADLGETKTANILDFFAAALRNPNISALTLSGPIARDLFPNLPISPEATVYFGLKCDINKAAQLRPDEARDLRGDCLLLDTTDCVVPRTKAFAVPLRPGDVVLDPSKSFEANMAHLLPN